MQRQKLEITVISERIKHFLIMPDTLGKNYSGRIGPCQRADIDMDGLNPESSYRPGPAWKYLLTRIIRQAITHKD